MIVRSFAGDDDVVDVAFAQSGVRDAHEAGLGLQIFDGSAAEVAHSGAESADELVDHGFERSAVRYASFDAFGDELGEAVAALFPCGNGGPVAGGKFLDVGFTLEVAFAAALGHGAEAAHAAIGFEAASLVENGLAWALVDSSEKGAHHADAGARGDGLGDIAGVLDAAVGNDGDTA